MTTIILFLFIVAVTVQNTSKNSDLYTQKEDIIQENEGNMDVIMNGKINEFITEPTVLF